MPISIAAWHRRRDAGRRQGVVGMMLVTGATGFVGGALTAELFARGLAFRAASRDPRPGFVAVGDFDAGTDWGDALTGVDIVVHLAARTHVMRETATDVLAAYRAVNVTATMALARQAAAAGVRRFVFLSSIKVNGEATPPGQPFSADDPPRPDDAYGRSKWEAEQALRALGRDTGMEIVVIRPPLVYGPGVRANFASLVRLAMSGLPLPFASVRNARSLVFVGNLVDAIILCSRHPAAAGETFLVADAEAPSIGALMARIAVAGGRRARLLPVPPSWLALCARLAGKPEIAARLLGSLCVDTAKIRQRLGWTPPYTQAEGLRRTLAPPHG